jgi:hypothetical protein
MGVFQLCGTSAECLEPSSDCRLAPTPLQGAVDICTLSDGGADASGGSGDDGSPSDASTGNDAPSVDDTSSIDDASPSEGGNDRDAQVDAEGPMNG